MIQPGFSLARNCFWVPFLSPIEVDLLHEISRCNQQFCPCKCRNIVMMALILTSHRKNLKQQSHGRILMYSINRIKCANVVMTVSFEYAAKNIEFLHFTCINFMEDDTVSYCVSYGLTTTCFLGSL